MNNNIFAQYYHNIFAASFLYYTNPKLNVSARIGAVCVNVLCQMTLLFLAVILIDKYFEFDALKFANKFIMYLLIILLISVNFLYYNKKRILKILDLYELKTTKEQYFWQIITVVSGIAPLVCIAILLKK